MTLVLHVDGTAVSGVLCEGDANGEFLVLLFVCKLGGAIDSLGIRESLGGHVGIIRGDGRRVEGVVVVHHCGGEIDEVSHHRIVREASNHDGLLAEVG